MEGKVHTVTFGVSTQMSEVETCAERLCTDRVLR